jgi:hypothetical protein
MWSALVAGTGPFGGAAQFLLMPEGRFLARRKSLCIASAHWSPQPWPLGGSEACIAETARIEHAILIAAITRHKHTLVKVRLFARLPRVGQMDPLPGMPRLR